MDVITIERMSWGRQPRHAFVVHDVAYSEGNGGAATSKAGSSPNVQIVSQRNTAINGWNKKLDGMGRLRRGWNGYSAPPPSGAAILTAKGFLFSLWSEQIEPSRVAPSAVGGVGITQKQDQRRVYVEFFNDGQVYALFSDDETEPRSRRITPGYHEFRELIGEIRDYLDA